MLTDDMIKLAVDNGKKCIIYNDDYVLLYKSMPVTDDRLDGYISKLNLLNDCGVNVSNIVEYKLVGPSSKFNIGSYTRGVFLEKRAKGSCIGDIKNINISNDEEVEKSIDYYLENINKYLVELENRSNASSDVYDKLISDYLNVYKVGLSIDPKPLNFFYDQSIGFTIIDLIDVESKGIKFELELISRFMYIIIFGYNFPRLSYNYNNLNIVPKNLLDKFNNIMDKIDDKLIKSLLKVGVDKNLISNAMLENREKYSNLIGVDNFKEIVYEKINEIKNIKNDNKESLNFTF